MRYIFGLVVLAILAISPSLAQADYYGNGYERDHCGPHCQHEREVARRQAHHHYDHY